MRRVRGAGFSCALVAVIGWGSAGVAVAEPTGGRVGSTPPPAAAAGSGPSSADAAAAARARATGAPVEVVSRRSPTEQVFARPDGNLSATVSARPVRVQRKDGSWVPVDLTLRRTAGGLVPTAATVDLTLADGGGTTLATVDVHGKSLAMSWPTALPAPVVSGATATYADVLPGVDLRLTADAEGFEEQLVVRTAAAAANPALRTIRFGLATAGGLTVQAAPDGALSAVDSAGGTVFRSAPPVMWDTPAQPEAVAAGLPGLHRAAVGVRVADGVLELTPDPAVLAAPDLSFPLVIDPSWSTKGPAWTEVNSYDPDSTTWRTVPTSLAVGYQNYQPPTRVRSFIRFPLSSAIYGTQIRSATLRLFENWSPSCTAKAMQVYATGSFGASTSWNHQPAWGTLQGSKTVAYGHDAGCPAANLEFNTVTAVAAAAKAHGSVTLGLRAVDENDALAWKKFQVDGTTPQLTVVYNRPPRTPTAADLSTAAPTTSCGGTVQVNVQNGVLLKVRATDPDADKVRVIFSFTHVGGSTIGTTSAAVASGGTLSWQIAGRFNEGETYTWKAYVQDVDPGGAPLSSSGWSPTCTMLQNGTRPNQPKVTSADYPAYEYGSVVGRTGTFSISRGAPSDTDIVGYLYGLDQASPTAFVAAVGTEKTATVTATPPTWGPHDLYVQTKDSAGNLSTPLPYHFYVTAPTGALALWKLDEGTGTAAAGTVETSVPPAPGPTATLAGGATWTAGRLDGGLHFNGSTGSASTPLHVATDADLTVSAWVRLPSKGGPLTVLSEDGGAVSGFSLGYRPEQDRFAFTMSRQDGAGPVDTAWATSVVPLNTWVHLTGVQWRSQQKIGVYVDGALEGTAVHPTAWAAGGTVQIGRGKPGEFWPGDVDEVRVYDRALVDSEVADVVNYTKADPVAVWRMDDGASSPTAADTSGRNHPLTKGTGNSFSGAGYDNGCMVFTATTAASAAAVVNTAGSFSVSAWVKLSSTSATVTALSEVGGTGARFAVAALSTGKWVFNTTSADTTTATVWSATAPGVPTANRWTFLAASWDAASGQARLWVDGQGGVPVAASGSWNATSAFLVGGSKAGGVSANRWDGAIDDVRVHDRVLYAGEPADLYREGRNLASVAAPDGRWHLDEAVGTPAANDSSGRNRPMTLSGAAAFAPTGGHAGGALALSVTEQPDGTVTGGGTAATTYSATRTDRSFAVSAWVKLADGDRQQAVVSQDGVNAAGFSLSYVPDGGGSWVFVLPDQDAPGAGDSAAAAVAAWDTAGAWVRLVAEYDSFTRVTQLWVADSFGTRAGYGRRDTPWNAAGSLRLGRDRTGRLDDAGGTTTVVDGDFLAGSIDEVTLYTGSLSAGDRSTLLSS